MSQVVPLRLAQSCLRYCQIKHKNGSISRKKYSNIPGYSQQSIKKAHTHNAITERERARERESERARERESERGREGERERGREGESERERERESERAREREREREKKLL